MTDEQLDRVADLALSAVSGAIPDEPLERAIARAYVEAVRKVDAEIGGTFRIEVAFHDRKNATLLGCENLGKDEAMARLAVAWEEHKDFRPVRAVLLIDNEEQKIVDWIVRPRKTPLEKP